MGLPVLRQSLSSVHAVVTTPAESPVAFFALFTSNVSLPRISAGSASALPFTRPAQRSLALRPARSPSHFHDPLTPEASTASLPSRLLQLLPAGAKVAGWGSHPLRNCTFARRTEIFGIGLLRLCVRKPASLRGIGRNCVEEVSKSGLMADMKAEKADRLKTIANGHPQKMEHQRHGCFTSSHPQKLQGTPPLRLFSPARAARLRTTSADQRVC